jgi:hypothetical protein
VCELQESDFTLALLIRNDSSNKTTIQIWESGLDLSTAETGDPYTPPQSISDWDVLALDLCMVERHLKDDNNCGNSIAEIKALMSNVFGIFLSFPVLP